MLKILILSLFISINSFAIDYKNKEEQIKFINKNKEECNKEIKKSCYKLGDFYLYLNDKENSKLYLEKGCLLDSPESCYTLKKIFNKEI